MIVDDHPIVRSGLRLLIEQEQDLNVCGEASSAEETNGPLNALAPDLVLLDITMGGTNGIELTKSLRETHPHVHVLILSMHDEKLYAERALKAGASGYLMKQESPDTVIRAIRCVLDGNIFVSSGIGTRIIRSLSRQGPTVADRSGVQSLSDRELEVYEQVGNGHSTREIADMLFISAKTVDTHKANIKRKLQLHSAAELTRYAIRWVERNGEE